MGVDSGGILSCEMDHPSGNKAKPWALDEHIAFECALVWDERAEWEELKARDVAIGRSIPEGLWTKRRRREIARAWLATRLEQEPALRQAAESVEKSISLCGVALATLGAFAGFSGAAAAMAYTGAEPINVSLFFAVFVLLQALLALGLMGAAFLPQRAKDKLLDLGLFRLSRVVFVGAFRLSIALATRFLEARQVAEIAEVAGLVRSRLSVHKPLFGWLAFSRLQGMGLFFNLGALTALLLAVALSDRAFGWQTTLDVSASTLQEMTRMVAFPWSWWQGEGRGFPSLTEIEGSRIVLKEGIRSLETENLVAWWRFLALGIVTYGVLPRLFFRALGTWQLGRTARAYEFGNAAAVRLFDRLERGARLFEVEPVEQGADGWDPRSTTGSSEAVTLRFGARCLIERSLAASLRVDALAAALGERWKCRSEAIDVLDYEQRSFDETVASLDAEQQLVLVVESWMPPIKETERLIRKLRQRLGERGLIRIVALGLPEKAEETYSLHAKADDFRIWDRFVRSLGDPYLVLD